MNHLYPSLFAAAMALAAGHAMAQDAVGKGLLGDRGTMVDCGKATSLGNSGPKQGTMGNAAMPSKDAPGDCMDKPRKAKATKKPVHPDGTSKSAVKPDDMKH